MSSAIKYTINHRWAGKTVDIVGRGLSFITRGRYRTGLTRLAHRISTELNKLPLGERINFLDGKITASDGRTIIEDPLLKVGKDFGQIPVTELLRTPQGMAEFLRSLYLKSDRWGINIHHKFTPEQEKAIRHEIDYLKEQFDIGPNSGLSFLIKPSNWFCSSKLIKFCLFSSAILFSALAFPAAIFGSIEPMPFSLGLAPWGFPFLTRIFSRHTLGVYQGLNGFLTDGPTIYIRPQHSENELRFILSHEFIHHLKDFGFIQNDSIAEGVSFIRKHEITGDLPLNNDFLYGAAISLTKFLDKVPRIFVPESEDTHKSYEIGRQLGGVATQLPTYTENSTPVDKWRFMNIVAQCTTIKELRENLLLDATFRNYLPS